MNPNDAHPRPQPDPHSGERLSWPAPPAPRRAPPAALPAAFFGIPFAGFALFWISQAYHATSSMSKSTNNSFVHGFQTFPLFRLPFLFIGLGIVLPPLWPFLKGGTTLYAITPHPLIILPAPTPPLLKPPPPP